MFRECVAEQVLGRCWVVFAVVKLAYTVVELVSRL